MFFDDVMRQAGYKSKLSGMGNATPLSPRQLGECDLHERMVLDLRRRDEANQQGQHSHEVRPLRILGLDLGQTNDPSSAVLIERDLNWTPPDEHYIWECLRKAKDWKWDKIRELEAKGDTRSKTEAVRLMGLSEVKIARQLARDEGKQLPLRGFPLAVRRVQEWPLGTDYFDIVDDALLSGVDMVVPDFGGVGRPIYNMFRRRAGELQFKGKIIPIQTMSSRVSRSRSKSEKGVKGSRTLFHQVPKIELISSVIVAEQSARLLLPPDDPMVTKMMAQLGTFKMSFTKSSTPTMQLGAATGQHDDLVSSLALGLWAATNFARRQMAIHVGGTS